MNGEPLLFHHVQSQFEAVRTADPAASVTDIRFISAGETHPLRSLVLRPGQPLSACVWAGDEAAGSFHVGAFDDGELVGIASVMVEPMSEGIELDVGSSQAYRLRGMATHPDHRGRGYGAALLAECIKGVQAAGGAVLWCNARTSAAEFYGRNGFASVGEPFDIPGIGRHVVMWIDVMRIRSHAAVQE